MTLEYEVLERFANRPTLRQVAQVAVKEALASEFSDLALDADRTRVVNASKPAPRRLSIVDCLLRLFAANRTLTTEMKRYDVFASDDTTAPALDINKTRMVAMFNALSAELLDRFSQALIHYWTRVDAPAESRARWLAGRLRSSLGEWVSGADVQNHPAIAAFESVVNPLDSGSQASAERASACVLGYATAREQDILLPLLVVKSKRTDETTYLTWSLDGAVGQYASARQVYAAAHAFAPAAPADARWFLYEPEGDVFDALAQTLLECQLYEIEQLRHAAFDSSDELELLLAAITDVADELRGGEARTEEAALTRYLPEWLKQATAKDRLAYVQHLQGLALTARDAGGHAFNDGIAPLFDYAASELQRLIEADHPDAPSGLAGRVNLVVDKVVAVPVPSAGAITVAGDIERIVMSLVDFALHNLASLPHGHLALTASDDRPLPDWLTADYAKALVVRADIGQRYPALLRRLLVDGGEEVTRRRQLFRDEIRQQLPLKALEQKLRGQGRVTREGYLLVKRLAEGGLAVLRPLAFESRPGMAADRVVGMFVIGTPVIDEGPFLLYRPFAPVPLLQFASWSALREAIVAPGDLQSDVLAWLADTARTIYDNGGFDEPHYVRVGLGFDYAPIETPPPARLATETVVGHPFDALFEGCVQALVTLAERSSVSNAESRWATLQEGGWLLLEALLPLVSGEAATALWFAQLLKAARDLVHDAANQAVGISTVAPVLLTLGSLLLHGALARETPVYRRPGASDGWMPEASLASVQATVVEVSSPVDEAPGALPGQGRTLLDFAWTNPEKRLTAGQRERLHALRVSSEPVGLVPVAEGAWAGLLQAQDRFYVRLDQKLYAVQASEDEICIVGSDQPSTKGPWLARGADGQWQLDLTLRLRGGLPRKTLRQLSEENAIKKERIYGEIRTFSARIADLHDRHAQYLVQLEKATGKVRELFMQRMEEDLISLLDAMRQCLALNEQLRVGDQIKEKTIGEELVKVIRHIEVYEGLTLTDLIEKAKGEVVDLDGDDDLTAENVDDYLNLFRRLMDYQNVGLRWSEERDAMMQLLRDVPKVGEQFWHQRMIESDEASLYTSLDWHISRMWGLLELSFTGERLLEPEDAQTLKELRENEALHQALRSHAELERPNDYSADEQIAVLENALREYNHAADVAWLTLEQNIEGIDGDGLRRYIEEVVVVATRAENRLSELVREHVEPARKAKVRVPKVHRQNKRVIRTRGQRTVVGRVRADSEGYPGEVVDVMDSRGEKVIGTYHQHAMGEWVEVKIEKPTSPTGSKPLVPLAELRRSSVRLLGKVEPDIASARRQAKRAQEPEDMEDILVQKAEKLESLAFQLRRHLEDGNLDEADTQEVERQLVRLEQAANRLKSEGQQVRIEMIKAQPPTAARISYLDRLGKVNISSFNRRQNISGRRNNDYLQEFAIRDADNLTNILWWAHFHYASESAAPGDYTAAHLKLPAQRKLGYKALVKMAQNDREVVQIYRSAIGRELAQRLFLALTPGTTPTSPLSPVPPSSPGSPLSPAM